MDLQLAAQAIKTVAELVAIRTRRLAAGDGSLLTATATALAVVGMMQDILPIPYPFDLDVVEWAKLPDGRHRVEFGHADHAVGGTGATQAEALDALISSYVAYVIAACGIVADD